MGRGRTPTDRARVAAGVGFRAGQEMWLGPRIRLGLGLGNSVGQA